MLRRAASIVWLCLAPACLVNRYAAPPASGAPARDVRRSYHGDEEALRRETQVLVSDDGRVERDGREQEFFRDGTLEAERFYERGRPVGLWRTWFPSGSPRSEVDFGADPEPKTNRFWHPNGRLAAEGPAHGGVREGRWTYWDEEGVVLREGSYHLGLRDGSWTFWEAGAKRAEGRYEAGRRVGDWTLWDEEGVEHLKRAADVELPAAAKRGAPGADPDQ